MLVQLAHAQTRAQSVVKSQLDLFMTSLKNMSRKAIVAFGLVIWFGPSCFLIPQLLKDNVSCKEIAWLLPIFHGYTLEWWMAGTHDRFSWPRAVTTSVLLPVVLALTLLWSSHPKAAIICAAVASFALTAIGYGLLIA